MTIADYLKYIRAGCPERGTPLAGLMVGTLAELDQVLFAWRAQSAGHEWLHSLMVDLSHGNPVHPDTVWDVLHMIGIEPTATIEQVNHLAAGISVVAQRYQALMGGAKVPKLNRSEMVALDNQEAIALLRRALNCAQDMQVWTHDMGPQAITRDQLDQIISSNPTRGLMYRYPGSDCDDFAGYLRTSLATVGCGDVLGIVRIVNVNASGQAVSAHVINCAWLTDGAIQLIEPQGCKLVDRDYAIDGGVSNIISGVIL